MKIKFNKNLNNRLKHLDYFSFADLTYNSVFLSVKLDKMYNKERLAYVSSIDLYWNFVETFSIESEKHHFCHYFKWCFISQMYSWPSLTKYT